MESLEEQERRLASEIDELLPGLAEARRLFAVTPSDDHRRLVETRQAILTGLHARYEALHDRIRVALGLPEGWTVPQAPPEPVDISRASLTSDKIASTSNFDGLADALDAISALVPSGWLDEEASDLCRLDLRAGDGSFLSLTKNLRLRSEHPPIHRFRQLVNVGRDHLSRHPRYDHFAGASLVPVAVWLAAKLEALEAVDGPQRLSRLWSNADVDSTLMELFAAAACAEMGLRTEFVEETSRRTPDLRCRDPFPMVIECKRQKALSDYEIQEEGVMRMLFDRLSRAANARGVNGRFALELTVEAQAVAGAVDDLVTGMIAQCTEAVPARWTRHPWGHVAFTPTTSRFELSAPTAAYSPILLEEAFGWRTDLPEWDGICCRVQGMEPTSDVALDPLALVWRNLSAEAIRKRTWAPVGLFAKALDQIPPGEVGIVYVSYLEGARAEIADMRVEEYGNRLSAWSHSNQIRVPAAFLSRLYPRPLATGTPDLIESTVRIVAEAYGEQTLFDHIPALLYTQP